MELFEKHLLENVLGNVAAEDVRALRVFLLRGWRDGGLVLRRGRLDPRGRFLRGLKSLVAPGVICSITLFLAVRAVA